MTDDAYFGGIYVLWHFGVKQMHGKETGGLKRLLYRTCGCQSTC